MKKLAMVLVLYSAVAHAGEVKITETETGITAEYTGSPAETAVAEKPAATAAKPDAKKLKQLSARIEQLGKEADALSALSGTEAVNAANEKMDQIKALAEEIRQITGYEPNLKTLFKPSNNARADIRMRGKELQASSPAQLPSH